MNRRSLIKNETALRVFVVTAAIAVLLAAIGGVAASPALSTNADERASDVAARLQARGVAVKDWSLSGNTPNRLLLTVESEESSQQTNFTVVIMRTVAQAIVEGAQFTEYEVSLVAPNGTVVGGEGFSANDMVEFIGKMKWEYPASTNEEALMKVQTSLSEVNLGSLSVKSTVVDPDGADYYRTVVVAVTGSVTQGNEGAVSGATWQIVEGVKHANTNGAGIAVLRIDVTDLSGQFLVREMHDLETEIRSAEWTDEAFLPGWLSPPVPVN